MHLNHSGDREKGNICFSVRLRKRTTFMTFAIVFEVTRKICIAVFLNSCCSIVET